MSTDEMCRQWRPGFSIDDQDAFIRTLDEILELKEAK